ncbi:hypothetical protein U9M48_021556, partial [Paspalum notatum var. saurae]
RPLCPYPLRLLALLRRHVGPHNGTCDPSSEPPPTFAAAAPRAASLLRDPPPRARPGARPFSPRPPPERRRGSRCPGAVAGRAPPRFVLAPDAGRPRSRPLPPFCAASLTVGDGTRRTVRHPSLHLSSSRPWSPSASPPLLSPYFRQTRPPNGAAIATTLAAAADAAAACLTLTAKATDRPVPHPAPSGHLWASLSLADGLGPGSVEPPTGAPFPTEAAAGRHLLDVGLRKTSILGPKYINVYAFGVYADGDGLKQQLKEKYRKFSIAD